MKKCSIFRIFMPETNQDARIGVQTSTSNDKMASSRGSLQVGMNGIQAGTRGTNSGICIGFAVNWGSAKGFLLNIFANVFIILTMMLTAFGRRCW